MNPAILCAHLLSFIGNIVAVNKSIEGWVTVLSYATLRKKRKKKKEKCSRVSGTSSHIGKKI